jgi:hypothetical protein
MMVHDAEESQFKGPTDVLAPYTWRIPPLSTRQTVVVEA